MRRNSKEYQNKNEIDKNERAFGLIRFSLQQKQFQDALEKIHWVFALEQIEFNESYFFRLKKPVRSFYYF